jgi:hypothetical protein
MRRLAGPGPIHDIAAAASAGRVGRHRSHQVERHHGELHMAAALHEENVVLLRNVEQRAKHLLGLVMHLSKGLAAVADLHDGAASASEIQQFVPDLFQNFERQFRGTCRKIKATAHSLTPKTEFFLLEVPEGNAAGAFPSFSFIPEPDQRSSSDGVSSGDGSSGPSSDPSPSSPSGAGSASSPP